jgi:aryl-alcohol dehydrogenase-like predicted oxidoreductase
MQLLRFTHGPETVRLGDVEVRRLGLGTSALDPDDRATAHAVLRRAVELGVQFIDVARDLLADQLIHEALSPYPGDLVIASKVGVVKTETAWQPALHPEDLIAAVEADLKTLRLEQLQIVQLRWAEQNDVGFAEALDVMIELRDTGKVRHLALGNIKRAHLETALARTEIVSVENVLEADLLAVCEQNGVVFVPVIATAPRSPTSQSSAVELAAKRHNCTPAQLVIASLLARSPQLLPIPTAAKVSHLEENLGAVHVAVDHQTANELAVAA